MSRYIDADALKESVKGVSTHWLNDWSTLGVLSMIDKQPTVDAVPVCRCRDCKYSRVSEGGLFKSGYFCERCHIDSDMENVDDWFCADGERRTDGRIQTI